MDLEIGQRLGERRRAAGLSQEELAEKLGVSRQAVSNWERAQSAPDTDNLLALAKLYGITVDALLNGSCLEQPVSSGPAPKVAEPRSALVQGAAIAAIMLLSAVFYTTVGPFIAFSVMDDITELFGLTIGTTLALGWIAVEIVLMAAPIIVAAGAAHRLGLNTRLATVAPVVAYFGFFAMTVGFNAFAGMPSPQFPGIGHLLAASVVFKADLVGAAVGLGLSYVFWRQARPTTRPAEA
jgi:transcriptional regulator with XRE-family HTH domain